MTFGTYDIWYNLRETILYPRFSRLQMFTLGSILFGFDYWDLHACRGSQLLFLS